MLRTDQLDYHLPDDLIATSPVTPRDTARLMVLWRSEPSRLEHRRVSDLTEYLRGGDVLVVNRTRVLPARFRGVRVDTGGRAEGLYLGDAPVDDATGDARRWRVLLKLRRSRPGVLVRLNAADGSESGIGLRLVTRVGPDSGDEAGGWISAVEGVAPGESSAAILARIGLAPLPPYILAARRRQHQADDAAADLDAYQTVYARCEEALEDADARAFQAGAGSVAAPTAGLHFTPALLERLAARGVERAEVVLHVGMGTFKPVEAEYVEQHAMHAEWCGVPRNTAECLGRLATRPAPGPRDHRSIGRPSPPPPLVLAVGTTSARTLESFASIEEMIRVPAKQTRILITPGHRFRHVGALMTNFHLPRSTLMAMVAAFLDDADGVRGQGLARLLAAYHEAVARGYRFYSFGDAMLILP